MSEFEDTGETKEERYNAVVREAAHAGLSIFQMLQQEMDLIDPGKDDRARGRRTGMAQAIAIMRSPYSWRDGNMARRVKMIKSELDESDRRRRMAK